NFLLQRSDAIYLFKVFIRSMKLSNATMNSTNNLYSMSIFNNEGKSLSTQEVIKSNYVKILGILSDTNFSITTENPSVAG
ncbi:hypothetical protein, partial [Pectobacterium brasiliense]|uniref:hypothetical protein n=1 Tax=Pectobacterium brasiliense TaxID=180957 RepID=UPI0019697354